MNNDLKKKAKKTIKKATKTATKKVAKTKKTVTKAKKVTLNKLNDEEVIVKDKLNEVIEDNFNKVECVNCHKYIDKGLSICPYCHKKQKDLTGSIVISILGIVLVICLIGSYFVTKYSADGVSETEYKKNCPVISYEELVRSPKTYKNKTISVIGKVKTVEGTDVSYGNQMVITINANLFNSTTEQLIQINYMDKNYNQGFIAGDLITVYGKYTEINGNTPLIKAEYIIFGK